MVTKHEKFWLFRYSFAGFSRKLLILCPLCPFFHSEDDPNQFLLFCLEIKEFCKCCTLHSFYTRYNKMPVWCFSKFWLSVNHKTSKTWSGCPNDTITSIKSIASDPRRWDGSNVQWKPDTRKLCKFYIKPSIKKAYKCFLWIGKTKGYQ